MSCSFEEALSAARSKYPYPIDHFEEYEKYYVFEHMSDVERMGGMESPIVIRKSDGKAFNYAPIFFNLEEGTDDVGDVISEGAI
jgi:hypothetical protein